MKYPFPVYSNNIARGSILLIAVTVLGAMAFGTAYVRSPSWMGVGVAVEQPLPFSHQHHVQGLGLDCRYCHTSVETSANAGLPDSATCLGCHSQIWKQAPMLQVVRESVKDQRPLRWLRVNWVPDYVYFNHGIHLAKGIGCVSCHGDVSRMSSITQRRTFLMKDCLSCHDHPEAFLRPREQLFNETWAPANKAELGEFLRRENQVRPPPLTDCVTCHR